ncbi:MAG: transcription initiation factor IIB [Thaumarchaeota archaeon]|nr:transcription initiation factor IIB [Nitrososphaerota archaeon]
MSEEIFKKCKEVKCVMGPLITDNFSGEVLCGSCGLVLIDKVEDSGSEARIHDMEEYMTKSRTGTKISLAMYDMGLPTVISSEGKDALGNFLSGDAKNTFHRLRIWDKRSKSGSKDRTLKSAFVLLDAMKTKLAIPDTVIEKTAYIYRKALNRKISKGRSITSLICASLYAACRETDTPRTLHDIANAANINKKILSRSYRNLIKALDLKLEPFDSSEFITRISGQAGISEKTRRDALNILSKAMEKEISAGKNPLGLAAAALYISCLINHEKKNQEAIARAAGITAVTIRNRSISLRKELGIKV